MTTADGDGSSSAVADGAAEAPAKRPLISGGGTVGVTVGGAALFLLLRMFAVSEWNWHTARDVLGSMDFGNVVPIALGTIVAQPLLTGIIVAVLLPVAVVELFWPSATARRSTLWTGLLVAALVVVFIASARTFSDWWLIAVMVAVAGLLVTVRLMWRRGAARDVVMRMLRSVGVIAGVAFLLMAAIVPTPWMPREHITTQDGGVVDGYVLRVESGFLQVLTADDHVVVTLTTSDVSRRETVG